MKFIKSPCLVRLWQFATATVVKSSLIFGMQSKERPSSHCLRKSLTPLFARHAADASAFFFALAYFQSASTRKRRRKMLPNLSRTPPAAV